MNSVVRKACGRHDLQLHAHCFPPPPTGKKSAGGDFPRKPSAKDATSCYTGCLRRLCLGLAFGSEKLRNNQSIGGVHVPGWAGHRQ